MLDSSDPDGVGVGRARVVSVRGVVLFLLFLVEIPICLFVRLETTVDTDRSDKFSCKNMNRLTAAAVEQVFRGSSRGCCLML